MTEAVGKVTDPKNQLVSSQASSPGDAEAIRHLEEAIMAGKHWYLALLEAMGLWTSAEETHHGRTYRYLIDGEAFDWLLLAERLCESVDGLLPEDEKRDFLFYGKPPLRLSAEEVRKIIGDSKFGQYLNYFYGCTVEEALLLAVKEEVYKERQSSGLCREQETTDEAYLRIYGAPREGLLERFWQERGYPPPRSVTIGEMKEFTYWRFKYRLSHCEKAKVASDTKKALRYLKHQWAKQGLFGALVTDEPLAP